MNARDIPEYIQWHEGMLLTPEHFHQMSLRQEMLLAYGLANIPYLWGVRQFQWDANRLAAGTMEVTALEAVLPDGLVAALDEAGSLKLDLKPFADEMKSDAVPVNLVVPARKRVMSQGDLERYSSQPGGPAGDESLNGNVIPRLRPRLSLLAGSIPPKYIGFPLLRVSYQNEVFTASPDHPLLFIEVHSRLGTLCSAIAQKIREKAMYLSERAQSPEGDAEAELETKRLIHCLVAGLPQFEALLYTGTSHPYSLYLALAGLAGNLAGVGLSKVPPVFPPYDHNYPYPLFEELRSYIFQVIAEGISDTWSTFRFQREGDAFVLPQSVGWADQVPWGATPRRTPLVLALRASSGSTEKDMLDWGTNCVIGSQTAVRSLVSRRILGAPRRHVDSLEDLIPGKGTLLFELSLDPEFIRSDEDLQVFDRRITAVSPADVVLFVRKQN
jgi:type VI secretion system protein ImpJ